MELEPVTSGHTLTDEAIARIETELEAHYPSICIMALVAPYYNPYYRSTDAEDDKSTRTSYWEQRFTFLCLVLAAEGEL